MRILHVHTRYRESGGEDVMVDAERQLLSSASIDLATLDFQNPSSTLSSASALAQAPWNRSAAERVVSEARRNDADVVHVHNAWFALSPAVVVELRRAGYPVVMTFHNYRLVCVNAMLFRENQPCEICVGGSTLPGIRYRCYRDSVGASVMAFLSIQLHRRRGTWADDLSVAVVLTEFARVRLLRGGLPPERTVVKPNFVADPGTREMPPSTARQVLFVGRLSTQKGIDRLVSAWRAVETGGLELAVIGSGPMEDELRAIKDPSISLFGQLDRRQVTARMLEARALIVPSQSYEGQPTVILEALAAGLPIFHTELGALGETCGEGGVPLGMGDIAGIASALRALGDDDLVDSRGRGARAEFESRFTERESLDALERIYDLAMRS